MNFRMTTANNANMLHRVNSNVEQNILSAVKSAIDVVTLPAAELDSFLKRSDAVGLEHVLGVVTYARPLQVIGSRVPTINIELPPLQGEPLAEVWSSVEPTVSGTAGIIRYNKNSRVLFGCMEIHGAADLQAQTEAIYRELLGFVQDSGYPYLLRVWNHFPRINDYDAAMERYQMFCVGRYNAFQAHCGTDFQLRLPAASAIGTKGDLFSLHFIAAIEPGMYLENPRQISAYRYPAQYGPCSPSFARATLFSLGDKNQLILSGTASIVGHETLHSGDPEKQLEETLRNIDALLHHDAVIANQQHAAQFSIVKVYVRHPGDISKIRPRVSEYFGEQVPILYLHGDICRSDLLLEIEGICDL